MNNPRANKKKNFFLVASLLCLTACTSSRERPLLYVLDTRSLSDRSVIDFDQLVVIKDILLAEHISETSLMMQRDEHQLSLARRHLWNENLSKAIKRSLIYSLNTHSDRVFVGDDFVRSDDELPAFVAVEIHIDKAYPNANGRVFLSGSYWVAKEGKKKKYVQFNLADEAEKSGYLYTTATLRKLVTELAQQMDDHITAMKVLQSVSKASTSRDEPASR